MDILGYLPFGRSALKNIFRGLRSGPRPKVESTSRRPIRKLYFSYGPRDTDRKNIIYFIELWSTGFSHKSFCFFQKRLIDNSSHENVELLSNYFSQNDFLSGNICVLIMEIVHLKRCTSLLSAESVYQFLPIVVRPFCAQ